MHLLYYILFVYIVTGRTRPADPKIGIDDKCGDPVSIFRWYVDMTWLWQVTACHLSPFWQVARPERRTGDPRSQRPKMWFLGPVTVQQCLPSQDTWCKIRGQVSPLPLTICYASPGRIDGRGRQNYLQKGFLSITGDSKRLWTWDLDSHLADPRRYQTPHGRLAWPPARPPKTQKTVLKANQKSWRVGTLTIGKGTQDLSRIDLSHL